MMNIRLVAIMLFLGTLVCTQIASAAVFTEDFNDNLMNTELWIPSVFGDHTILQERNQRLEVIFPPEAIGEWMLSGSYRSRFQLRGDYDIQVDFSMFGGSRFDNGLVWLEAFDYVSRGHTTSLGDGYAFEDIVPTTDLSGKLRLTRKGNIATGYYYGNGEWVSLGSVETPMLDQSVGFGYNSNGWGYDPIGSPLSIALDNFIINEGQIIPTTVPEPSSLLVLAGGLISCGLALRRRH
jgi:hypothetical protein